MRPTVPTVVAPLVILLATGCLLRRSSDTDVTTRDVVVDRSVARDRVTRVDRELGGRPFGAGDPRRSAAQPATSFDPVGDYDFTFTDGGRPLVGSMTVRGTPGTYTGRIVAETRPEVAISTVTTSGPLVTVTADVPNDVLLMRFRMTGDSLAGDWSLRGQGGRVTGRHRAAGKP